MKKSSIGIKVCPNCKAIFNMFEAGQMVIGTDGLGVYMEHVPCGHRGRPTSPDGSVRIQFSVEMEIEDDSADDEESD